MVYMIGVGDIDEIGFCFLKHPLVVRIDESCRCVSLTEVDGMLHAVFPCIDARDLYLTAKLIMQHPHDFFGYLTCSGN